MKKGKVMGSVNFKNGVLIKSEFLKFTLFTVMGVLVLFLLSILNSQAEETGSFTALELKEKTNEVLDRAVEVYGGEEFLKGINNVRFEVSGTLNSENIGASPSDLYRSVQVYRNYIFQIEEGRFYGETRVDDAGSAPSLNGSQSNYVFLISDEAFYLMFPRSGIATTGFMIPGVQDGARPWIPHLALLDIHNERSKVIWIGTRIVDGKTYDLMSHPEKNSIYLFSKETGYLVTIEATTNHFLNGKMVRQTHFKDYSRKNGLVVPGSFSSYNENEERYVFTYQNYNLNAKIEPAIFIPPSDIEVYENVNQVSPPRFDKLSEKVTLAYGPLHTLFVEFDDYVIVVEVNAQSAESIQAIREATGNKPIRFAVASHHHSFHVEGLQAFANEGIPVITTSQNVPHFEALLKAEQARNPDLLSRQPIFEVVDDRRVFDDGTMRLEIINVGPIGHADNMFIAWLPNEGIVFSVDMLALNPHGLPPVVGGYYRQQAIDNFNAILGTGINPKTFVTGHANPLSIEEMREVVFGDAE
ncbi:MAG: hypothetical protein ACTSU8_03875 [Alphaproteobacteria bacterium]